MKTLRLALFIVLVISIAWVPLRGQIGCSGGVCSPFQPFDLPAAVSSSAAPLISMHQSSAVKSGFRLAIDNVTTGNFLINLLDTNGLDAGTLMSLTTGGVLSPTGVRSAANTALVIQAGVDATTTGGTAVLTQRGEDVTAGSTASAAGGAIVLRGGNVAATGGSATGGNASLTGGNCGATSGSCVPGTATIQGGGFSAGFTNGAPSDVILAAGLGTGTGAVSHFKIQSPALGLSSGTAAQTQVTRFVNHTKAGSTTSATPTTIFNINSATNTAWGVEILVHVDLISSTPNVCGTTERFSLTGTNNNGAFGTVNIVAGTISTLCSTGTLTFAVTATAANPSVISLTPTWATITSITSATITVQIQNVSQQEITLL